VLLLIRHHQRQCNTAAYEKSEVGCLYYCNNTFLPFVSPGDNDVCVVQFFETLCVLSLFLLFLEIWSEIQKTPYCLSSN